VIRLLAVHQGGGLGGAPVSLLKLLAKLDAQTSAIFTEPGEALQLARELSVPARLVPTGGALYYSAHARLNARGIARFIRTFPAAVRTARNELRARRPDVLHLNTSVVLAWAVAARRERVPVVWVVREVLGARWQARFIQRHASRLVLVSNAVRACFPPEAAARVVYNAVDLAEFSPTDGAGARADLGLGADEHVLMVLGAVQRAKGHWLMLDALSHLRTGRARLVLVTGGASAPYAQSLKGRVKRALNLPLDNLDALLRDARARHLDKQLLVTGWQRDIPRVLAAADVVVFPSIAPEGFGRPIIEAMAMARPVVATDIGPSRELLGTDAGRLVPLEPLALADAIGCLLQSPDLRQRMGSAGRARAEDLFGLDHQVEMMMAIYREAAGSA
jgi:glycosyltransferase involved in cell wall biosynthesis